MAPHGVDQEVGVGGPPPPPLVAVAVVPPRLSDWRHSVCAGCRLHHLLLIQLLRHPASRRQFGR